MGKLLCKLLGKKIKIQKDKLLSKKIFFTNDPFNRPQFVLTSNNFKVEILKNEKIRLISKNTWVNFGLTL